jgi:hypothetical protein
MEDSMVGGACGTYWRGDNVHKVLVRKPEEKRPFVRPRRRWEDWIRMDLREIGGGGVDSGG